MFRHPAATAERLRHHRRQLRGPRDRLDLARRDDGSCDAPALLLLAEREQHVGDLAFAGPADPLGRAFAPGGVHAHVERTIILETEPALRLVDLWRRNAQIEQHAVESRRGRVPVGQRRETVVPVGDTRIARSPFGRDPDRFRVLVHHQQTTVRTQSREDLARMPATSEGAVEVNPVRPDRERCERLVPQHRHVHAHLPFLPSGVALDRAAVHKLSFDISGVTALSPIVIAIWR